MSTITSTLQTVHSPNFGADLIVAQCGWDKGTDEASIIAGTAPVDRYVASQDGRHYIAEWHVGPSSDVVYVERVERGAVEFHGWIDAASRKIVQAG